MPKTVHQQMDVIYHNGLKIIKLHERQIVSEWDKLLLHLHKIGSSAVEKMEDTIHFFSYHLFNRDHKEMHDTHVNIFDSSIRTNQFIITLLENAVHKVIRMKTKYTNKDHQAVQYVFIKLSEDILSHPYQQYFSIDTFLQSLVSSRQLPIEWAAIVIKKNNTYIVKKWFNNKSKDLLVNDEQLTASTMYALTELLLSHWDRYQNEYNVLPIPYNDMTLLICLDQKDSSYIVPFLTYTLQIFENGKDSYHSTKYNLQWKDSVILFNELIIRSKNYHEALENITAGFVNYLPFERCALFSYSSNEQIGFGLFGHRLDNKAIQSITEDISELPLIRNHTNFLQLFGKSLNYIQPIYINDAMIGFPKQYIEQFNLRSVVISPIFLTSNNRLIAVAIMDQGPGKYFKISQETFTALKKFGRSAGEILAKYQKESFKLSKNKIDLSAREIEVLMLMAEGDSTIEAAAELNLSEYTVRDYVSSIMEKMNARNRTEAVAKAIRLGLI